MLNFILKKMFWGGFRHLLSDLHYIKIRYRLEFGFWPDLKNPKRFSEKIQVLKLRDRSELRRIAADRLKVRDYVKKYAGESVLIPLIGSYNILDDCVWEELPASFALKASHGSGMVHIVRRKEDSDKMEVFSNVNGWLQENYYRYGREWVYKGLQRFILAEELLLDEQGHVPSDFKFFCYHGRVKFVQVDLDRFDDQKRNLYDENFNRLEASLHHPSGGDGVEKPALFEEAKFLASKLSGRFNFIRVDLYILQNRIYFGELTNFPGNGFEQFTPDEYDTYFGEMLNIS
jgi:hypothetical protein